MKANLAYDCKLDTNFIHNIMSFIDVYEQKVILSIILIGSIRLLVVFNLSYCTKLAFSI